MPVTDFAIPETFSNSTSDRTQGQKITYTYDSMNRRVARTDEFGTTQYLYGNPNHPFQLTAVRSPSGSLSRYHYDDFGLLFALEQDNNWYYITTDQLGTPRVVCDANGELVKVLEYDSFGQVIADSNPEFELHITFAGGLIDVDTELVRFGFRDYDAVAGKWTAKDPTGFSSDDANLYRYVGNDSTNFIDPFGLDAWWEKLVNWGADLITASDHKYCGLGKNRDATQYLSGQKCPVPISEQDRVCIIHDYALAESGSAFWQLWKAQVSQIHSNLSQGSTHIGMKLLFGLMSLPGLPGRAYNGTKNWVQDTTQQVYTEYQDWLREQGYMPPFYP